MHNFSIGELTDCLSQKEQEKEVPNAILFANVVMFCAVFQKSHLSCTIHVVSAFLQRHALICLEFFMWEIVSWNHGVLQFSDGANLWLFHVLAQLCLFLKVGKLLSELCDPCATDCFAGNFGTLQSVHLVIFHNPLTDRHTAQLANPNKNQKPDIHAVS